MTTLSNAALAFHVTEHRWNATPADLRPIRRLEPAAPVAELAPPALFTGTFVYTPKGKTTRARADRPATGHARSHERVDAFQDATPRPTGLRSLSNGLYLVPDTLSAKPRQFTWSRKPAYPYGSHADAQQLASHLKAHNVAVVFEGGCLA